jgi:hypothetical protein
MKQMDRELESRDVKVKKPDTQQRNALIENTFYENTEFRATVNESGMPLCGQKTD